MEIFAVYLHLLAVLVFAGLLAAACGLCNEHLQPGHVRMLARIDAACIATAVVVLLSGLLLLVGYDRHVWFILTHPIFWTKFAMFVGIGAVAVYPSLQFHRWNRAIAKGEDRILTTRDIRCTRRVIFVELVLLALMPLLAAWLARSSPPSAIRP